MYVVGGMFSTGKYKRQVTVAWQSFCNNIQERTISISNIKI